MYSNVDSLLNKKSELEARISVRNPDIIALVEIFPKNLFHPVDDCELQIGGYNMFLPAESQRGVIIYCKKNLQSKQVVFKDSDFMESVWCAISSGSEYFLFGCVYRSPNSSDPNNEALLKLFYEIENSPHTNIFIVGDFNLPKIDWDIPSVSGTGNKFARDFVEVLQNLYLSQLVEEPTRMRDGQKSNVLDLVITNQVDMVDCLVISPPIGKSDHMVLDFRLFLPGGVTSVPVTERFASSKEIMRA